MSRQLLACSAAALVLAIASVASHAQTAPTSPSPAVTAAASADASALQGKLAYYSSKFAGRKTASGERFDPNALTMAHKTLPFGTLVRVTNVANKKSVVVRVNDRGPTQADRIGDLSPAAAKRIGMTRSGVVEASLTTLGQGGKRNVKRA